MEPRNRFRFLTRSTYKYGLWGPKKLNKSVSVTRVGIKNEEEGYEPTNTAYENAAPGVGAVLRKHEYLSLFMIIIFIIQCCGAFRKIYVGNGARWNIDICVPFKICVDFVCYTPID